MSTTNINFTFNFRSTLFEQVLQNTNGQESVFICLKTQTALNDSLKRTKKCIIEVSSVEEITAIINYAFENFEIFDESLRLSVNLQQIFEDFLCVFAKDQNFNFSQSQNSNFTEEQFLAALLANSAPKAKGLRELWAVDKLLAQNDVNEHFEAQKTAFYCYIKEAKP